MEGNQRGISQWGAKFIEESEESRSINFVQLISRTTQKFKRDKIKVKIGRNLKNIIGITVYLRELILMSIRTDGRIVDCNLLVARREFFSSSRRIFRHIGWGGYSGLRFSSQMHDSQ